MTERVMKWLGIACILAALASHCGAAPTNYWYTNVTAGDNHNFSLAGNWTNEQATVSAPLSSSNTILRFLTIAGTLTNDISDFFTLNQFANVSGANIIFGGLGFSFTNSASGTIPQIIARGTFTFTNAIRVDYPMLGVANTASISLNGPVILNQKLSKIGGSGMTIAGQISGSGGISANTALTISGTNNTYTGKTTISNTITAATLMNAGQNCSLGAPTGPNAIIDMADNSALILTSGSGPINTIDRTLNSIGTTADSTLTFKTTNHDNKTTLNTPITWSGTGRKTLILGSTGLGDRFIWQINAPISNAAGGSAVSVLLLHASSSGAQTNAVVLAGTNDFSGTLTCSNTVANGIGAYDRITGRLTACPQIYTGYGAGTNVLETYQTNSLPSQVQVYLGSNGAWNLNFAGTQNVAHLYINGVQQNVGTYGTNGVANTNTLYFTGNGVLNVTSYDVPFGRLYRKDASNFYRYAYITNRPIVALPDAPIWWRITAADATSISNWGTGGSYSGAYQSITLATNDGVSLFFDGLGSYVGAAVSRSTNIINKSTNAVFSYSFWAKPTTNTGGNLVFGLGTPWGSVATGAKRGLIYPPGSTNIYWNGHASGANVDPDFNTGIGHSSNAWEQIGVNWNNPVLTIYKNGYQIGTTNIYLLTAMEDDAIRLGGGTSLIVAWQRLFAGFMDDIRVWTNINLTAAQWEELYLRGRQ